MKEFFKRLFGNAAATEVKNRAAVQCLKELDFSPAAIRRALLELNQVRIRKFVNGTASPSMVYSTIKGSRKDPEIQRLVAQELGLKVEEVFPEAKASGG